MKHVVVLGDGMADYPVPELGHRTPLQVAVKPNIDRLARLGQVGMVKTIPDGMAPGSDVANLSVMGYDPRTHYSGRSPLEAISMGVVMDATDLALRCNLVTLSDETAYADKTMLDYSAGEISTEEARILIEEVHRQLGGNEIAFYPGVSYRHCMIQKDGPGDYEVLTPPHDISLRKIADYLPKQENARILLEMMRASYSFLKNHPVNQARTARGLNPANSIWLWGQGRKPDLPPFFDKYGQRGSVISAVDLLKGIGICAGMRSIDVPGATGTIHTNFVGKAQAAIAELEAGQDFVYVHIEAPDECGHHYEIENKVRSIELIDEKVIATVLEGLEQFDNYRIMVLPDHPTPLATRTHASDPVPFLIYQKSSLGVSGVDGYDEFRAQTTGVFLESGPALMNRFIRDG